MVQVRTHGNGEWRILDIESRTLTRRRSFSRQHALDPRMAFLIYTDDATLDEFPSTYTLLGTGVDAEEPLVRWWDVQSRTFGSRNPLRIWTDERVGGLPIRSRTERFHEKYGVGRTETELTYRHIPDRDALLIETASICLYDPRPATEAFNRESWTRQTTMTLSDVTLLDDEAARRALRPDSEFGQVTKTRDLTDLK